MIFTSRPPSLIVLCILSIVVLMATLTGRYARAEILIGSNTYFDIKASDPVNVGNTPLKAVTLTAYGKEGCKPNAFDSTNGETDGTGITTTDYELHQVGIPGIDYYTPTNYPQIEPTLDTHFLINPPDYLGSVPEEDMVVADPTDHTYGQYGSFLIGTFTLDGTPTESIWPFAKLVVKEGAQIKLDFTIAGSTSPTSSESILIDEFTLTVVPEPGSLLLVALGVLGLLVFRSRRHQP